MARIRTFIALGIDSRVQSHLQDAQVDLARLGAGVKWVEDENFHLTLFFLGEVPELELVAICREVGKQAKKVAPFALEVKGIGCFPNLRRPKILWAGIGEGSDELIKLHTLLEKPLLELGCYRREDRAYTPHITLGRITQEDREEDWGKHVRENANWYGGTCHVKEVFVMSSELNREGPVYSIMSRARLSGSLTDDTDSDEFDDSDDLE